MRAIIRAAMAALRAMTSAVRYVWERSAATGEWIMRAVASIGAAPPPDPIEQLAASIDQDLMKPVKAKPQDDWVEQARRVCRALNRGVKPDPADLADMDSLTKDWIYALSPQGRLVVGNVQRAALESHLRGAKTLRGVCAYDRESVAAYIEASRHEAHVINEALAAGEDPEEALERTYG